MRSYSELVCYYKKLYHHRGKESVCVHEVNLSFFIYFLYSVSSILALTLKRTVLQEGILDKAKCECVVSNAEARSCGPEVRCHWERFP